MQNKEISRREFVKFIGGASALALNGGLLGCTGILKDQDLGFTPIKASSADDVLLAKGFDYKLLIGWGDAMTEGDSFGFNNDYTAFLPLEGKKNEGLLWVNHEYPNSLFVSQHTKGDPKTRQQVDKERYCVGGSVLHIKMNAQGRWDFVKNSKYNRRITGATEIPIHAARAIGGKKTAVGTMGNCAGGVTPWNTVLTCEENVSSYYGSLGFRESDIKPGRYGWDKFYNGHPHHYGWVVEVNPLTGAAKKHVAMGRFAHECATTVRAKDGRVVVYTGDDRKNEHIYKFISESKDSLDKGELFVANLEKGEWMSLDIEKQPLLKKTFKDQTEVYIHTRKAAKLLGATPCDRPEDIEVNPANGDVLICLTNNYNWKNLDDPKNNFYGSILKISEADADPGATKLSSEDFVVCGEELGFACPDNITFDRRGNLWVSTDISGSMIGKGPYKSFGNNGLFYVPMKGPKAGQAFQVASAPVDAEFTGITFSPDGKTLFLAVQHPGERSASLNELTSHWPDGKGTQPRPAVIQIHGPALERLTV